jgi:hypothetical protein
MTAGVTNRSPQRQIEINTDEEGINHVKVKVKITLEQATKAQRGVEV